MKSSSIFKKIGITIIIIMGLILILILLRVVRLESGTYHAGGSNLTVCKTKKLVIGIGEFSFQIGKDITTGCAY